MQECSLYLNPLPHKLSVFLILAVLTGVRWNLRVVLICISLMAKDFEHFLKCLLAILDSSVESSLFRSVPHYLKLGCLLMINFLSFSYILEINPQSFMELVRIFSHFIDHGGKRAYSTNGASKTGYQRVEE